MLFYNFRLDNLVPLQVISVLGLNKQVKSQVLIYDSTFFPLWKCLYLNGRLSVLVDIIFKRLKTISN